MALCCNPATLRQGVWMLEGDDLGNLVFSVVSQRPLSVWVRKCFDFQISRSGLNDVT